jgi:hypothetical protein
MDAASVFAGIVCTAVYLVLGLGAARFAAKLKSTSIHILHIFLWPILLAVMAGMDDIA